MVRKWRHRQLLVEYGKTSQQGNKGIQGADRQTIPPLQLHRRQSSRNYPERHKELNVLNESKKDIYAMNIDFKTRIDGELATLIKDGSIITKFEESIYLNIDYLNFEFVL